jgi:hypothetical protein
VRDDLTIQSFPCLRDQQEIKQGDDEVNKLLSDRSCSMRCTIAGSVRWYDS